MIGTFAMIGLAAQGADRAASKGAARAESRGRSVERQLKAIQANLAKSMMVTETLWELLRDEHGWTDEDLHKKLYEIDMRDGVLDGKNQRQAAPCSNCGRTVSPRHPACLYCGQVIDSSVFTV